MYSAEKFDDNLSDKENNSHKSTITNKITTSPVFSDKESALAFGLTRITELQQKQSATFNDECLSSCSTPKPEELLKTLLNNEEIINTLESFVKNDPKKSSSTHSSDLPHETKLTFHRNSELSHQQEEILFQSSVKKRPASTRASSTTESSLININSSSDELYWLLNEIRSIADCLRDDKCKLNREREQFKIWNLQLREREDALTDLEVEIGKRVHMEVERRLQTCLESKDAHIKSLDTNIEELSKENTRLKESFNQTRQTNDTLRAEVTKLTAERDALLGNVKNLQGRLIGLKRKINQDFSSHRDNDNVACGKCFADKSCQTKKRPVTQVETTKETSAAQYLNNFLNLNRVFEFLNRRHLRFICVDRVVDEQTWKSSQSEDVDFCLKNLPHSLDLLRTIIPAEPDVKESTNESSSLSDNSFVAQSIDHNLTLVENILEFVYWSISLFNRTKIPIRGNIQTSINNLAHQLYRQGCWKSVSCTAEENSINSTARCNQTRLQMLCCLFLLRVLRNGAEQDSILLSVKSLLRSCQMCDYLDSLSGLAVLLSLPCWSSSLLDCLLCLTSSSQVVEHTTDILLYSMKTQNDNEVDYFSKLMNLLVKKDDKKRHLSESRIQIMEKAAVLLQKLSKIKRAHQLFDKKVTLPWLKSLQSDLSGRPDTKFLNMNLVSILKNLNVDAEPLPTQ